MTEPRRIVIVGGVAAGMSAATRLRRLDERARITVIEKGAAVSLATCGMPYVIGGDIAERDALLLQTPERLRARFDLDVRVRTTATAIDRARRVLVVESESGIEELPYDDLVLATGAEPVALDVPGGDRALALRGLDDLDRILAAVDGARTAVVIGGGFIGLEVAENLHQRGIRVALVHRGRRGQFLTALDGKPSRFLQRLFVRNDQRPGSGSEALDGDGGPNGLPRYGGHARGGLGIGVGIEKSKTDHAATLPTRMQAALLPAPTDASAGMTFRHSGIAMGQRGLNAQPDGMLARSGGMPGIASTRSPAMAPWMVEDRRPRA